MKTKTHAIPKDVVALLGKPTKTEPYNTCNGWGFGGIYGTISHFRDADFVWITGRVSTRHQGTFPVEKHLKINGMWHSLSEFKSAVKAGCKTSHDFYNHRYPEHKIQ